jgi:hypothetical protein
MNTIDFGNKMIMNPFKTEECKKITNRRGVIPWEILK